MIIIVIKIKNEERDHIQEIQKVNLMKDIKNLKKIKRRKKKVIKSLQMIGEKLLKANIKNKKDLDPDQVVL